jgi:hypothetical protein
VPGLVSPNQKHGLTILRNPIGFEKMAFLPPKFECLFVPACDWVVSANQKHGLTILRNPIGSEQDEW